MICVIVGPNSNLFYLILYSHYHDYVVYWGINLVPFHVHIIHSFMRLEEVGMIKMFI